MNNLSPPFSFNAANFYTGSVLPNTIHTDSALTNYYRRYLLQKAQSVYVVDGLPDVWPADFLWNVLYIRGYLAILDAGKFGTIPMDCGLSGLDLWYRPKYAIITNPLIPEIDALELHRECELIRLTPDYSGVMDKIEYYAQMMSLISQGVAVNIQNSKLSFVFPAGNKAVAESYKQMLDDIYSGKPAVVFDKNLLADDGSIAWDVFSQNLQQNYITPQMMDDLRAVENQFAMDFGLPNTNSSKRERMSTQEVNITNVETFSRAEMWLDCLNQSASKVNDMFGLNISFRWRHEPEEVNSDVGEINDSNT